MKIEILGYYVDPDDERLQSILQCVRAFCEEHDHELVERLSATTELDLSYERLEGSVEGNLVQPHLAKELVKEGIVPSIEAAFDEYLAEGGSAFVPMKR